ncbi:MAG: DNA-binding protein [Flavobacteriaceae bacterium]|nr:DNA-binding protein [Flavobacteriaceae bacterium]
MITYATTKRDNRFDKKAKPKHYGYAVYDGEVEIDEIVQDISTGSTLRDIDVAAVLLAMENVLAKHLANGKIVKFGTLGTFRVTLNSEGAETEEAYNSSYIKNSKIRFRESKKLRLLKKTFEFKKRKKVEAQTSEG